MKEINGSAEQVKPTLDEALQALRDTDEGTAYRPIFYGLSALEAQDAKRLQPVWAEVDVERRRSLMRQMADLSETDFELDYRTMGTLGLEDPDAKVRIAAIDALWIDESIELMNRLVDLSLSDEAEAVRAAAASALGRFILLGEYEEIEEEDADRAVEVAVELWTHDDEPLEVRRRALEALSNSSHPIVTEAITEAYNSDEHLMRVSAVFAMGRSCDKRWEADILREMQSQNEEMRYEAARSAGELAIAEAVPYLGRLSVQDEREIKEVAIWSLGEIGGQEAMRILSALAQDAEEANDDDLLEVIEEAIDTASLLGAALFLDDFEDDYEDFDDD